MANNIEYKTHTVSTGGDNTDNTLLKISELKGIDVNILTKLNPNYDYNQRLSAGTKVLISVGSMTNSVESFSVATLTLSSNVYVNFMPKDYTAKITNSKGEVSLHTIETDIKTGKAKLSLDSIVKQKLYKNVDVATLMSLNPGSNQMEYYRAGKIILLEVCVPGDTTMIETQEFGILPDTTRTCYIRWEWDHEDKNNSIEGYEVKWGWQSSDGKWWHPNITKISDVEVKESTYSPDEKAVAVDVTVRPVAKSGTSLGQSVKYEWSTRLTHSFELGWQAITPSSPPSIEIKNYKLTATYENLPVETGSITHVEFQIWRDNEDQKHRSSTLIPVGPGGYTQYSCTIDAGHKYRVRARCCKQIGDDALSRYFSSWTSFTSYTNTLPTKPENLNSKVLGKNVVQFTWSKVNSAESYDIQYVLIDNEIRKRYDSDEEYFNNMSSNITTNNVEADKVTEIDETIINKVPNIEFGEYYARVRAVNDTTSEWSDIVKFVLGKKPDSPTTWSSTTTVGVGEPLRLYWVHNAKDGSEETAAQIEMTLDGNESNKRIYTIIKTANNTLASIAASVSMTVVNLKSYNPKLNVSNNDILPAGTIVRYGTRDYIFIKSEDEDITSYFEIDTDSYREGTKIDWRVRTAGVLTNNDGTPAFGDEWSIKRTVDIYAPPVLTVNLFKHDRQPLDKFLTSLPFTVNLSVGNTTNQKPTGYYVSVIAKSSYNTTDEVGNDKTVIAGSSVFSKYYDVNSTSYTVELSAKDLTLNNNEEYEIVCTVSMSSGLMTETTSEPFTVAWIARGYKPNAEVGVDKETLTARIRPFAAGAGDSVSLFVYRREFDGSFTELVTESNDPESGLDNTNVTWITDPHPALDYARYRIVSREKSTGIINYFDVPGYPIQEKSIVIQWDEKWQSFDAIDGDSVAANKDQSYTGSMLKLPYNIDVSNANSPDVSLVRYIGRKRPVSYYGTQLGESATWNTIIPKSDRETLYALRRLATYMGNVYVREPSGSGYWANITISFSQRHLDLTIPVTINVTPVEGGM